jgi:integrase
LGEFLAELLELRTGPRGQRLSIASIREYRTIVGRFVAFVGADTRLDQLTVAHAMRYVAALRSKPSHRGRPLSLSSINKHKQTLKSAMNVAIVLGYLQTSPFASIKKDKVPEQAIRYVDPAEFAAIARACRNDIATGLWWECFLAVCYTAATRLNEAAHLTWADVDFGANTIRIVAKPELDGIAAWRPKDHDPRTIPVPDYTVSLLSRLHAAAEPGAAFVFLSTARVAWIRARREDGRWPEGRSVLNNVNEHFKTIAHRAGVVRVTLHDLRRACITHWARKIAAPVVQALAGHADINTTLRYYVSIREPDMAEAREVTAQVLQVDPM